MNIGGRLCRKIGNLLGMGVCANCGLPLEDKWKFCIHCGARVDEPAELETAPASAGAVLDIGAAPEPVSHEPVVPLPDYVPPYDDELPEKVDHVGPRRFRLDWQLALGVLLAGGGVAMIVYLVVVLVIPHA